MCHTRPRPLSELRGRETTPSLVASVEWRVSSVSSDTKSHRLPDPSFRRRSRALGTGVRTVHREKWWQDVRRTRGRPLRTSKVTRSFEKRADTCDRLLNFTKGFYSTNGGPGRFKTVKVFFVYFLRLPGDGSQMVQQRGGESVGEGFGWPIQTKE